MSKLINSIAFGKDKNFNIFEITDSYVLGGVNIKSLEECEKFEILEAYFDEDGEFSEFNFEDEFTTKEKYIEVGNDHILIVS